MHDRQKTPTAAAARCVARYVVMEGVAGLADLRTRRLDAVDRKAVAAAGARLARAAFTAHDENDEWSRAEIALLLVNAVEGHPGLETDLLLVARHRGALVVGRRWERPTWALPRASASLHPSVSPSRGRLVPFRPRPDPHILN